VRVAIKINCRPPVVFRELSAAWLTWRLRPVRSGGISPTGSAEFDLGMNPRRAILVSLLPALLLVASLESSGELFRRGGRNSLSLRAVASAKGQRGRPAVACASVGSARHCSRRFELESGPEGFSTPELADVSFAPPPEPVALLAAVSSCPPELARGWQFKWRAALLPRAPTSAS
jgi:hypothetical protein